MFSAFRQFALPHRELEFIDRTQQDRIERLLGRLGRTFILSLQVDEHRQLILQDRSAPADRLFRIDRAIGFDVDDQLVEIRALLRLGPLRRCRSRAGSG